jgi:large subunit ribosomal protein L25
MTESENIVITVNRREETGKEAATRLRHEGRIPAVVYGGDKEPLAISVGEEAVQEILKSEAGFNTIFLLKLKGTKQERRAMIKEVQTDPITHQFLHLDFIRVTRGHKLNVSITVIPEGDCVGVRHGGLVDFVSRELNIEILPREMIDKIVVDISELDVGEHISVADLAPMLPESGKFLEDPSRVVLKVEVPRAAVEEAVEEEGLEEEGELVTDEQAEPEVISSKGKGDEEAE